MGYTSPGYTLFELDWASRTRLERLHQTLGFMKNNPLENSTRSPLAEGTDFAFSEITSLKGDGFLTAFPSASCVIYEVRCDNEAHLSFCCSARHRILPLFLFSWTLSVRLIRLEFAARFRGEMWRNKFLFHGNSIANRKIERLNLWICSFHSETFLCRFKGGRFMFAVHR